MLPARKTRVNPELGCAVPLQLIHQACLLQSAGLQQVPDVLLHAARFEWPALAPLTFTPSLGHLPAGTVKDVVVTYVSEKPLQLKAVVTVLKAAQLKVPAGTAASDWDNRIVAGSVAAAPEPKLEIASAKEATPVSVPLKVHRSFCKVSVCAVPVVALLLRCQRCWSGCNHCFKPSCPKAYIQGQRVLILLAYVYSGPYVELHNVLICIF